jgi:hypothetical protein
MHVLCVCVCVCVCVCMCMTRNFTFQVQAYWLLFTLVETIMPNGKIFLDEGGFGITLEVMQAHRRSQDVQAEASRLLTWAFQDLSSLPSDIPHAALTSAFLAAMNEFSKKNIHHGRRAEFVHAGADSDAVSEREFCGRRPRRGTH